jgi:hypothetical protein
MDCDWAFPPIMPPEEKGQHHTRPHILFEYWRVSFVRTGYDLPSFVRVTIKSALEVAQQVERRFLVVADVCRNETEMMRVLVGSD